MVRLGAKGDVPDLNQSSRNVSRQLWLIGQRGGMIGVKVQVENRCFGDGRRSKEVLFGGTQAGRAGALGIVCARMLIGTFF